MYVCSMQSGVCCFVSFHSAGAGRLAVMIIALVIEPPFFLALNLQHKKEDVQQHARVFFVSELSFISFAPPRPAPPSI